MVQEKQFKTFFNGRGSVEYKKWTGAGVYITNSLESGNHTKIRKKGLH